jgi:adenylate cyclase class 2
LSTETEIKVEIQNPEDFCGRLTAFSPHIISIRHFEDNQLLDFPDALLQSVGSLLRIRQAEGKAILTFKGSPKEGGVFKTREELETGLDDGILAMQILERLGMRKGFRYQKYRREFKVDTVIVAVDETPIGNYAELEGSETAIYEFARRIGLEKSGFLRHSYYSLYLADCRLKGKTPGNMVF